MYVCVSVGDHCGGRLSIRRQRQMGIRESASDEHARLSQLDNSRLTARICALEDQCNQFAAGAPEAKVGAHDEYLEGIRASAGLPTSSSTTVSRRGGGNPAGSNGGGGNPGGPGGGGGQSVSNGGVTAAVGAHSSFVARAGGPPLPPDAHDMN